MSVNLAKNPPLALLREFNFTLLGENILENLFGEVSIPFWLEFKIEPQLDVLKREFVFHLVLSILPHHREWKLGNQTRELSLSNRKRHVFKFPIPVNVIEQFRGEVPRIFTEWMTKTLKANAYHLYEFDPRIGWTWNAGTELPMCPLLDPPEPFSRTGRSIRHKSGRIEATSCFLCDEEHREAYPVWMGANLMWVHEECAEKVS